MRSFLLLLFLGITCSALGQFTKSVSLKGQRPLIDLTKVPDTAFEKGSISVKFKQAYKAIINRRKFTKQYGVLYVGISKVDALNKRFNVSEAQALFQLTGSDAKNNLHDQWGLNQWFNFKLPANANIKAVLAAYQQTGIFETVEPLYKVATTGAYNVQSFTPNDPTFIEQWNLKNTGQLGGTIGKDLNASNAWDIEKGKPQVIVAMIDRGIQYNHPDLAQNMWSGIGYNFVTNSPTIIPEDHATCTAGIVGAVSNNGIGISGIAGGDGTATSGIRLMSCQIFSGSNNNGNIGDALIWAADHGACIASNSWVFTNPGVYRVSVLDAIDYFCANGGGNVLQGGLVICAAGNNGEERLSYPGCYEKVIGVAATNNKDIRSPFSNYGDWVDIAAPAGDGVGDASDIPTTTTTGYGYFSGTSASSPHVTGVAALVASKLSGKASASDVRNILLSTTDDIYPVNPNYINKLGTGRVNAFKALQKAQAFIAAYTINPVTNFSGTVDCSNMQLNWAKNSNNHDVVIAYDPTANIGIPVNGTTYTIGSTVPGGGTVIYKGSNTTLNYIVPNNNIFQYFKIWSVDAANQYSFGRQLNLATGPVYPITDNTAYIEGIESPSFPTQSLRVSNPDNNITWSRLTEAKHGGSIAAFMNNFDYTNIHETDILYLPLLKITNADSVRLSFWRAYKAAATADSLAVIVSTDCGKTFRTIWQKGGADLATVTGNQSTAYVATDFDWKKETIAFAVAPTTDKVQVGFKAINGHGQNLYLDDIAVNTKTLPEKLKQQNVLMTPNPFNQQFVIQHYLPPTSLRAISVYNMLGQRVVYQAYNGNADSYTIIDMAKLANGLYEVRLDYANSSLTQKMVKQSPQ